jgi:hypothetical protein
MRSKIIITAFLLIVTYAATGSNSHGYYRIHRDSAATAREIDKNLAAITANIDTITTVSSELATEISSGIEKNGIWLEIQKHERFYYPIIFFGILFLIWLKTRDR